MVKPSTATVARAMRNSRLSKIYKDEVNVIWKTSEKKRLLAGLREHGCEDIHKLQTLVKSRSAEQIEYFIGRRRESAKRKVDDSIEDPAIEVWIERATKALCQKHDYSKAVIEAIAKGSETASNYAEVYGFLLRLLKNEPTPDLSHQSSVVMLRLLKDLALALRTLPLVQIQSWFDTLDFSRPLREQTVPDLLDDMDGATLLYSDFGPLAGMAPSLNPLAILPQILQFVDKSLHVQI